MNEPSHSPPPGTQGATEEIHIMLSNSWLRYVHLGCLFAIAAILKSAAGVTTCPWVRDGKPIENAAVFDDLPGKGYPQASEGSGWAIARIPPDLWHKFPPYYLVCTYRDLPEPLSIEIPRSVTKCDAIQGPNIVCQ